MKQLEHSSDTKKKQFILIIGGAIAFVALLVFGLWFTDPDAGKPSQREIAREKALDVTKSFRTKQNVSDEETWIAKSEEKIQEQTDSIKKMSQALRTIQDRLEERGIDVRVISDKKKKAVTPPPSPLDLPPTLNLDGRPDGPPLPLNPLDAFASPQSEIPNPLSPVPPAPSTPIGDRGQAPLPELFQPLPQPTPLGRPAASDPNGPEIQVVTLGQTDQATGKPKQINNAKSYLPAGSFATVRLLSGVDAPTGDGSNNPIPVLLRVMTEGTLPNFFRSNVSNCHIVASAWGSLASERATIQLETLSCVLLNGGIIETKVKGYVSGEDGKHGMRGRLVSKQGSLVARALLSGLASGFGQALQQQSQRVNSTGLGVVTTIQPNQLVTAGAGAGISNAMQQISQYYLERAQEIFPIIEIAANREGEAILQDGVSFDFPIIDNTREEREE